MSKKNRFLGLFLGFFLFSFNFFAQTPRLLVFSKTAGYRHASIGAGRVALTKLGQEKGFVVDTTEDATAFREDNLKQYQAVVFLCTTGDILNLKQQNAFERYIEAGGGFLGIHSASDTEYDWPWYGKLVGAYFDNHPSQPSNVQKGTFHISDKKNALTSFLPEPWIREDEFYAFKKVSKDIKVLITIDEKSYIGGTMGDFHPMAWYQEYDGGRAFYTNMGHTDATFSEPLFLQHLWAGLSYAMGGPAPKPLDYNKARSQVFPDENRFSKVVLEEKLNEPMELALLPGGKVLFIERHGDVKLFDPAAGKSRIVVNIPVSTKYLPDASGKEDEAEDGLLGLAKDPGFDKNHWLYFYYSPAGKDAKNILARYEWDNDHLNLGSKKVLLEIPVQREKCCHTGGSLAFDGHGNLLLSTGDNTSPRESDGMNPIDERLGRSPFDAQKSSANTNDLRGKILRIHPEADGTYRIPDGNLFPKGMPQTRPEIYTMGHRNPFRIAVDPKTNYVYWGDVGPDASKAVEKRGPEGQDEIGQARQAGNFGWPYFVGDNKAYNDYDFAAKKSGALFDAAKPVNNSPNNTGLLELPPAQKAFIWYPYAESKEFPLMGTGGRNAMAGPVYYADDFKNATRPFPAYFDQKLIIYEWMRGKLLAVSMDADKNYASMEPIMPSHRFSNPMDMEFSTESGDLYLLEYGTGWFQGNDDARLVRIEYNAGNRKPFVEAAGDKLAGAIPLMVKLSAAGSMDYDGDPVTYEWVVKPKDKKGKTQRFTTANPALTLSQAGVYEATLTVSDNKGLSNSKTLELIAGNEPPMLDFDLGNSNKTFFFPGNTIHYKVNVTDKEDGSSAKGTIPPDQIAVNIEYLPEGYDKAGIAQGHRAADRFAKAVKIMEGTDCNACHKARDKSIGPNYHDIALKYKEEANAVELLSKRIISGSTGVWGQVAMAAHPALSPSDAAELVRYILSHGDDKLHPVQMPTEGDYPTSPPKDVAATGAYFLRAAYRDRGAGDIPQLSNEKTYVLRHPNVGVADPDDFKDVQKMEFGSNKLVIPSNKGYFGFKQIDLTGIAQVQLMVNAPKQFNLAGGTLEMRLNSPNGPQLGSPVKIEPSDKPGFAGFAVNFVLPPTSGEKDLYFVCHNDTAAAAVGLFVVTGLLFQDAAMAAAAAEPPSDPTPAPTPVQEEYTGRYKMSGLPFPYIDISIKEGKVHIKAGDQEGDMTPLGEADKFDAAGQAIIEFVRDDNKKVIGMKLAAQGANFEGEKEE